MSSATTKTAPVDAAAAHSRPAEATHDPLLEENARLVNRVRELQVAVDAAGRDRAGAARAEMRRLRSEQRAARNLLALAQLERTARIRLMLRDTHSRNP